jgi:replicative DNA helicase
MKMNDIIKELKKEIYTIDNAIDKFVEQNNRLTHPLKSEFEFIKWIDEGRVIVVGGGSGLGKTAFSLQLLYNLVKENQNKEENQVLGIYASAEMSIEELTMRLLVNQNALTNKNEIYTMMNIRNKFNTRLTNPKEVENLKSEAKFLLSDIPFYFLNASRFNLDNIIQMIQKTREKNPDKRIFIVIDYLQLLLLNANNLQEMNRIIAELKYACVENKVNSIVISALNRDSIRNDYVDISAFKDSSLIEYMADMAILFSFKNENGKPTLRVNEEIKNNNSINFNLYSVKNRINKHFDIPVIFHKLTQNFDILEKSKIGVEEIPYTIDENGLKIYKEEDLF